MVVVVQWLSVCDSSWPHGLQHSRLPCPSPSPRACLDFCPLSWWCHWWLTSTSSPSSLSQIRGWKWTFQHFNHKIGSTANQPPSLGDFQSHLIHNKRHFNGSHQKKKKKPQRILGSLNQEQWCKTKYMYFLSSITIIQHPFVSHSSDTTFILALMISPWATTASSSPTTFT